MSNVRIDKSFIPDLSNSEGQETLAHAHKHKKRLFCGCTEPNPELYVACLNNLFFVKRMPETGHEHDVECEHYAPRENVGKGQLGDAIRENVDTGEVTLRLGFGLSKALESSRIPKKKKEEKDDERITTKSRDTSASNKQIGITSLLHYLYEEAQFNRWSPKMAGKRSWWVVATHLRKALEGKIGKGEPLAAHTFIPRDNTTDDQNAFNKWHKQLMPGNAKKASIGIVIDELKDISEAKFGYKIELEHLPGRHVFVNENVVKRLYKNFEREFDQRDMGAKLIFIGAVYLNAGGAMLYERAGLLAVDSGKWLPMSDFYGNQLIQHALNTDRRFYIPMHYDLEDMLLPTITLTDTEHPISIITVTDLAENDVWLEEDVETIMWDPETPISLPEKAAWKPTQPTESHDHEDVA